MCIALTRTAVEAMRCGALVPLMNRRGDVYAVINDFYVGTRPAPTHPRSVSGLADFLSACIQLSPRFRSSSGCYGPARACAPRFGLGEAVDKPKIHCKRPPAHWQG